MSIMQNAVGFRSDDAQTDPRFKLGTRVNGDDGTSWVYVQADGAVTGAGYVCQVTRGFQATELSTSNDTAGEMVGVAGAALADNEYGWVQVYGPASIRVAASAAANAVLNTTATAGQLDDDQAVGSFDINGVILTTANGASAGTAEGVLNWPTVAMAAN